MPGKTQNSISEILKKILRINDYNLKILAGLTKSVISEEDIVVINLTDETGESIQYRLPSYSYMRKKIDLLDKNFENLTNLNNKEKFQPTTKVNESFEPYQIESLSLPTKFDTETNWFFKRMLDPMLSVKIDLTDQVHPLTRDVIYRRIILNFTEGKEYVWTENFYGQNDLDYDEVIQILSTEGIQYKIEDKQEVLPASMLKYSGSFSILSVEPDVIKNSEYNIVRKYKFDSIYYTDNEQGGVKNTRALKKGDKLTTLTGKSEYIVQEVVEDDDNDVYYVTLAFNTGYESLPIGDDVIKLVSPLLSNKIVKIPISNNEKQIIFFIL